MIGTLIVLSIIAIAVIGGVFALAIAKHDEDYIQYFKNEAKEPCSMEDYKFLSQTTR